VILSFSVQCFERRGNCLGSTVLNIERPREDGTLVPKHVAVFIITCNVFYPVHQLSNDYNKTYGVNNIKLTNQHKRNLANNTGGGGKTDHGY
jgi:hypothetical protein